MAFVIWAVFLTDLMRRRMSRVLGMIKIFFGGELYRVAPLTHVETNLAARFFLRIQ
jgi:hypothetical protein